MKILAVVGDYYHNEATYKEALSKVINKMEGIDLIYSTRESLLDKLNDKPDLVILASENRLNPDVDRVNKWLTESIEKEIINYVINGGAWLAWHSGLAGYEKSSSYIDMLGGYFTHHPEDHVKVQYKYRGKQALSKGNKGKDTFEITDEHYFIRNTENISVFLESKSIHGHSVAGWIKKYGEGEVVCYVPSHNKEGLMHSSVQKDLEDIVRLLLK